MDAQRSGALIDLEIDRALAAALAVEPSAEFLARVRTRIASEPEPSAWRFPWTLATVGAMALALVSTVSVLHLNQAMPPVETVLEPLPSRALVFASLSLMPAMVPNVVSGFSRTRGASRTGGNIRTDMVRTEPEVLIDAGEAAALRRLFDRSSEGRIDLRAFEEIEETPQITAALPVANDIEIAPITIEPLAAVNPEGARQ
jgi:hypothetical protein